ncbi:dynein light chain Tctex-type protein 2 [Lepisosteus oculatus]|uniref:dynein light chain Tctex-type protein 2 n=1 Tax=Lepisosteus oculatus TaxID=7918 RepID=UPI0035F516C6
MDDEPQPMPRRDRRRSMFEKGFIQEILQDRLKDANLEVTHVDEAEEDDLFPEKGGSAVWKPGLGKAKLANTYRMEPARKFQPRPVQQRCEEIMGEAFGAATYEPAACRDLACKVADDILGFAKEQGFGRYRYVVRIIVGQKRGQSVRVTSRAVWDTEKDNFISLTIENSSLFAVATVYALYLE